MHSCLSPCGDELMTPNNIVKMSILKGLEMIAVTDHNTAKQLPAVEKAARAHGIALLPGLEITTREEVHLLAYFRTIGEAVAFSDWLYPHLPSIKNKSTFFGEQIILDENDEPIGIEEKLLLAATDLSLDQLTKHIRDAGGLPVPAHINRGGNSLIEVLGFLPPGSDFAGLEVCRDLPQPKGIDDFMHLHSSDAHYLENILERGEMLCLPTCDADGFFHHMLNQ